MKALTEINVLSEKFHNFWMDKAYRTPNNPQIKETPTDLAKVTVPISKMLVRSLFVSPEPGQKLTLSEAAPVIEGVAFDGGAGIKLVEISLDVGATWTAAELGPDLGNYSWRRWTYAWKAAEKGTHTLMVRATSNDGQTQPSEQNWNHSGYARNVIESLEVAVA